MITEARVEMFMHGQWAQPSGHDQTTVTIPIAVEQAMALRSFEIRYDKPSRPAWSVRVVDSSGVVVQQWGKP